MKYVITKILNFGAGIYDRWAKHNLREIHKKLIELADLNGNEKVLDIGCGTGTLDLMVTEVLDKGSIYGIDIARKMVKIAKKKAEQRACKIGYRIGSSLDLPYKNNEFDVIFTSLIYHHLDYEEKCRTLREIYRALKSNGRYISAEFVKFPGGVFHGIIIKFTASSGILHGLYPAKLIEENRFYIDKEIEGPLLGGHHQITYRVIEKMEK